MAKQMDSEHALDTAVRLEVYRFFVDQGRPPVPAEVAATLATDQASVEDSLRRLAEAHVLALAPGTRYIWMANPLSAIPTPFQVEIGGRRFFGNCIWDALGVVAMLGGTGTVTTWCPDCDEPMSVTVADNRLASGEGVVHFTVSAAHWWDDIGFT
jgi:Alkylmercury lyase